MPVQHGESVVMRLLDQSQGTLNLESTGMPSHLLERFRKLIKRPHGMILVTGPTGSGKTTTLYGALTELNKPEVKIITAEDPVEYRLPRITQVQVNPKIGLEFAGVLRSALRQDPDIILVGEMRDHETVEIGLRAAMTGHLVLSTLHTNDSISSAMRLIDMGAEPFLVASSLLGVVAQRLVRRVCDNCTETYEPTEQELIWLRSFDLDPLDIEAGFVHGRGCYQCSNTGYRGRVGVYEMLEMDEDMLDALRRKDVSDFTRAARKSEFFRPLGQCAMDYALQGVTSLQEVSRVAATAEMGVSMEEDELSRDAIGVDS
jgi:MSHA biogenesis protein MshE